MNLTLKVDFKNLECFVPHFWLFLALDSKNLSLELICFAFSWIDLNLYLLGTLSSYWSLATAFSIAHTTEPSCSIAEAALSHLGELGSLPLSELKLLLHESFISDSQLLASFKSSSSFDELFFILMMILFGLASFISSTGLYCALDLTSGSYSSKELLLSNSSFDS